MLRCQSNKLGADQLYEYAVKFKVVDSKTSTVLSPEHFYLNDTLITATKSGDYYSFVAPISGLFRLKVTLTNYNDFEETYSYSSLNNTNINLTKIQTDLALEGNLKWDHSAGSFDFDSHTYAYDSTGSQLAHVYYGSKSFDNGTTVITLDRDDTGSNDGENTTIDPLAEIYKYHFYIQSWTSGSGNFATASANIKLTFRNTTQTLTAPSTASGKYWDVCKVENGVLTIINTFTDTEPT